MGGSSCSGGWQYVVEDGPDRETRAGLEWIQNPFRQVPADPIRSLLNVIGQSYPGPAAPLSRGIAAASLACNIDSNSQLNPAFCSSLSISVFLQQDYESAANSGSVT